MPMELAKMLRIRVECADICFSKYFSQSAGRKPLHVIKNLNLKLYCSVTEKCSNNYELASPFLIIMRYCHNIDAMIMPYN